MKITGFRFGRLRVPLRTPFKTIGRTAEATDDLVVMVDTDEGLVGYGSAVASAKLTGETHGSMIHAICHHIAPTVLGQDAENISFLTRRVRTAIRSNSSAKAAVDIALYDLFGQRHGVSTYRLLGGGVPSLVTDITISIDYIDKMVTDAQEAIDRGFEALRIEVGKDPGVDIERVKAVFAAIAGRAVLRLDAGQGWTPKHAVLVICQLEEAGVQLDTIEYPVKGGDIAGLQFVTERVEAPVVACVGDEGVIGATEIIQRRAADIITFGLLKSGGITPAVQICDLAAIHGVECMLGCLLEGGISSAAAAHLAVSRSDVITRVDLDGPSLGRFNPVESNVCFLDAEITINPTPGLGITAVHGLEPVPA